jgi:hypothetical protein
MKQVFFIMFSCCLFTGAFAQTRPATTEYQKITRPALVNEVPFSAKTVENAIEDSFLKLGYKSSSSKGFTVFKGVHLKELGPDPLDLYFMVDKKSKRDKENSIVTMMISKGFDAFINDSSDAVTFGNAKNYLDSLRNTVASYDLEQQISAQEDEVKKADKKNSNLSDEGKDLEKKKRKLENDIKDNFKDQENQAKELDKQKQILETLKTKRKQG